jgi:hypothetical protein
MLRIRRITANRSRPAIVRSDAEALLVYGRATAGFLALFLVLLSMCWSASPSVREPGSVLVLASLVGLARSGWLLGSRWAHAEAIRRAAARRAALRAARKARALRERGVRQARRRADSEARAKSAAARAARKLEECRHADAEATRRRERESAIRREAARLLRLDDARLMEEVGSILRDRGLEPRAAAPDAECDSLLYAAGGRLAGLVRCVPRGRLARASDVAALERWRADTGVDTAYLVALTGFSAGAVNAVRDLPITLVEAQLLANWRETARSAAR